MLMLNGYVPGAILWSGLILVTGTYRGKRKMKIDKLLHFMAGFVLSCAGFLWWPFLCFGYIAGVWKELIWDKILGKGKFEIDDMLWTFYGATIPTVVVLLFII